MSSVISPVEEQPPNSEPRVWRHYTTVADADAQIAVVPWPGPAYGKAYLHKVLLNNHSATIAYVRIYDRDLLSAVPTVRGAIATDPIWSGKVAANTSLELDGFNEFFQAGLVYQTTSQPLGIQCKVFIQLG